jgi:hypothetical protein
LQWLEMEANFKFKLQVKVLGWTKAVLGLLKSQVQKENWLYSRWQRIERKNWGRLVNSYTPCSLKKWGWVKVRRHSFLHNVHHIWRILLHSSNVL